jgi:hypothetical protein
MSCLAAIISLLLALASGANDLNIMGRALAKCDRSALNPADPVYPSVDGTHVKGTIELRRAVDAVNFADRCQHKSGPGYWVCANVPSAGDDSEYGAWWYARSGLRPMPDVMSDAYEPDFPLRFDPAIEPSKWPLAGPWCFDVHTLGMSIFLNEDAFAIVDTLTCDVSVASHINYDAMCEEQFVPWPAI